MKLKERLKRRELMLCAVVSVPSPEIVEVAAHAGFDFAILDAEHGPFTMTEIATGIRAAQTVGLPLLVRVPEPSRDFILRSLDAGADGIVEPEVESAAQAAALVAATHYPPGGHRGAAHYSRRYGYTKHSGFDALREADADVVVGVHIETPAGVEQAESIFAVPGIDLVLLGLSDLRVRLTGAADIDAQIEAATSRIGALSRSVGVAASIGAQGASNARRVGALGFSVTVSSVMPLLLNLATEYSTGCRAALENAGTSSRK